jgi:hypothetical protein
MERLGKIFKWIEIAELIALFTGVFWFLYALFCTSIQCQANIITKNQIYLVFQFAIPFAALINSLRIAVVFMKNDPDTEFEPFFYFSLMTLFASFTIFGINFQQFAQRDNINFINSPILFSLILTTLLTVLLLLIDKKTWDKSISFVRFRISLSLFQLIFLLINPLFGLILIFIISPLQVLRSDEKDQEYSDDPSDHHLFN